MLLALATALSLSTSGAPTLSEAQIAQHREAAERLHVIVEEVFAETARRFRAGDPPTPSQLQIFIENAYGRDELVAFERPVIARGIHSADPNFENAPPMPGDDSATPLREGDLLLVNVFARLDVPDAIHADITWMAFVGRTAAIPPRVQKVWTMVAAARDAALATLRDRLRVGRPVTGEELDEAARRVVRKARHEPWYLHPTGHALGAGEQLFGAGANLKRGDTRPILPGTCFTIEPGVYYPNEFGVRSEIDVCVTRKNAAEVTGGVSQRAIRALLD